MKFWRVIRDGDCILTTADPLKVVNLAVKLSNQDTEWWIDEETLQ